MIGELRAKEQFIEVRSNGESGAHMVRVLLLKQLVVGHLHSLTIT